MTNTQNKIYTAPQGTIFIFNPDYHGNIVITEAGVACISEIKSSVSIPFSDLKEFLHNQALQVFFDTIHDAMSELDSPAFERLRDVIENKESVRRLGKL
jgi:hypothetical protein